MLNFDEQRFIRIQSGAVGLAEQIDAAIRGQVEAGLENIFFLGTGGAAILMMPAVQLLQRRSRLPTFQESAAELILTGHLALGPHSLVIIPSLSGTTQESLAALDYCKAKGATVFTLVGHADTPLATGAHRTFVNFAEDDTSCESFYVQSLLIALSVMHARSEYDHYAATVRQLMGLPRLLLDAKRMFEGQAGLLAKAIAADPYHIVIGSGPVWPEACYYGMCILEEMQWIRTRPVHASDFFHGTLELVEDGVSVLLFKGEDETRPLADRVERFVRSRTGKLQVLDPAGCALPGLSPDVRALVAPAVLATLLERASAHLEVLRDHPLTTRRYYRRTAY